MTFNNRRLAAILAAAAVAVPVAAADASAPAGHGSSDAAHGKSGADHGKGKAKGKHKAHNVTYVFRGTYNADGTVAVTSGNAHVRKGGFVGTNVAFDFSKASIVVADVNTDGKQDLTDVQAGDKVLVQARLPRKAPGTQPFAARKLVDQTHAPAADDEAPAAPTPAPGS